MSAAHLNRWLLERMGLPEDASTPDSQALQDWQFSQLRQTIEHAKANSPYYKDLLAGIDPVSLQGPEDLTGVPRTDAHILREAPESLLCVSQDEVARIVTLSSSGSTGTPKRLFFTADDLQHTVGFFHRGMTPMADPGETVMALLPAQRPDSVGRLLTDALEQRGVNCICCPEPWDVPSALKILQESKASAVVGSPAHIHALAKLWDVHRLPKDQIRHALLCWDAIPAGLTDRVRSFWGCKVLTHWGMTETGLGGAVDCGAGLGMHLREADIFVEIVEPNSGTPLPNDRWGEITITTLSRRGMPLIRYRSGDLGRILPIACPCGNPLRLLDTVPGRLDSAQHLANKGTLARIDLDIALLDVPQILDFTVTLNHSPAELNLSLHLVPDAQNTIEAARKALSKILALSSVRINIDIAQDNGCIAPGFAKRIIDDYKDIA